MPTLRLVVTAVALFTALALTGCSRKPTTLEQVQAAGELVVLTREGPTTYYEGPDGPTGIEYDLALRFAQHLGVRLRLVTEPSLSQLLAMLERGEVHLAAAGLTITEGRVSRRIRFAHPYQNVTQQVIYRMGTPRPRRLEDLAGGRLHVAAGSSHAEYLRRVQRDYPMLEWVENSDLTGEELLQHVWERDLDYTVADSDEFAIFQRFYPELRIAFPLTEPQSLAWAFPPGDDTTLYDTAIALFQTLEAAGELEQLRKRYYGHVDGFDYVGTRRFMRHIENRLPKYRSMFEEAAARYDMDWRLLAAMGYQESHWKPKAQSPTGVRGVMMLTLDTAKQLGITNRLDPAQSIRGGAQYFNGLKGRLPARIEEPDRTWLALAAYNVGMGHLEDARVITQKRGGNPDAWPDVKKNLPLLSRKKWYATTKYGFARGNEPVRYVENIRGYYEILVRRTRPQRYADREPDVINLDSPTL